MKEHGVKVVSRSIRRTFGAFGALLCLTLAGCGCSAYGVALEVDMELSQPSIAVEVLLVEPDSEVVATLTKLVEVDGMLAGWFVDSNEARRQLAKDGQLRRLNIQPSAVDEPLQQSFPANLVDGEGKIVVIANYEHTVPRPFDVATVGGTKEVCSCTFRLRTDGVEVVEAEK
jgi:hypothetical protein